MLRWQLGSHYEVHEEVPVGKKPLQIDLLLLHREQGELPQTVRRMRGFPFTLLLRCELRAYFSAEGPALSAVRTRTLN